MTDFEHWLLCSWHHLYAFGDIIIFFELAILLIFAIYFYQQYSLGILITGTVAMLLPLPNIFWFAKWWVFLDVRRQNRN